MRVCDGKGSRDVTNAKESAKRLGVCPVVGNDDVGDGSSFMTHFSNVWKLAALMVADRMS
jgi:hypothetical protein